MSMMNWSLSALARSWAIAGVAASALRHLEQRPIDLVHRHEGGGHAGRGLEEPAAVQALLAAEIVGHREQPRLDLALPFVLRVGIEFVAGDDLGRDRRLVLAQFGRHQCGKFGFGQIAAHGYFSLIAAPDFLRFGPARRLDSASRRKSSPFRSDIARWCCTVQRTLTFKRVAGAAKLYLSVEKYSKPERQGKHHDWKHHVSVRESAGASRRHQGRRPWPGCGNARPTRCRAKQRPRRAARSGAANTGPRRATFPCGCFASGWARRRPASRRGRSCSSCTARRSPRGRSTSTCPARANIPS